MLYFLVWQTHVKKTIKPTVFNFSHVPNRDAWRLAPINHKTSVTALLLPFFVIVFRLVQTAAVYPAIARYDGKYYLWSMNTFCSASHAKSRSTVPGRSSPGRLNTQARRDAKGGLKPDYYQGRGDSQISAEHRSTRVSRSIRNRALQGFQELQNEFSEPLPEDKIERYKWQETMIERSSFSVQ